MREREEKETRRIRIKKSNRKSQERHRSLARDGVTHALIRLDMQRDGSGVRSDWSETGTVHRDGTDVPWRPITRRRAWL